MEFPYLLIYFHRSIDTLQDCNNTMDPDQPLLWDLIQGIYSGHVILYTTKVNCKRIEKLVISVQRQSSPEKIQNFLHCYFFTSLRFFMPWMTSQVGRGNPSLNFRQIKANASFIANQTLSFLGWGHPSLFYSWAVALRLPFWLSAVR